MISTFPLDLVLLLEEASLKQQRLKFTIGMQEKPEQAGWSMYFVPVGFGWRPDHLKGGERVPCILFTGLPHSRAVNWTPLSRVRTISTIPSHTPGRKSLELWKASWAK